MKRIYNHFLGLNNLRKFCGNAEVFKYAKNNFKLEILDKPKKGRVLVLAPHPDDDVFGCGGSIALHAEQGDKVKVIYFAGVKATKELKNLRTEEREEERTIDRRNEAENAAKVLKVSDIEFWGLADNKFTADKKNIERLEKVIKEYEPEIIYCPSFTDANPDHYEVAKILHSVIARSRQAAKQSIKKIAAPSDKSEWLAMTNGDIGILLYEVWTPIYANRLVKIDKVIEIKKAAIKCHQSQLSDRPYFDAIIGLNQYRAGMFNAGEYAEAFTEMNVELYLKMFEIYQLLN